MKLNVDMSIFWAFDLTFVLKRSISFYRSSGTAEPNQSILIKDFLKEIESEFLNFNLQLQKRKMVKLKNHDHFREGANLEEYVSEKIKFTSSIHFL